MKLDYEFIYEYPDSDIKVSCGLQDFNVYISKNSIKSILEETLKFEELHTNVAVNDEAYFENENGEPELYYTIEGISQIVAFNQMQEEANTLQDLITTVLFKILFGISDVDIQVTLLEDFFTNYSSMSFSNYALAYQTANLQKAYNTLFQVCTELEEDNADLEELVNQFVDPETLMA